MKNLNNLNITLGLCYFVFFMTIHLSNMLHKLSPYSAGIDFSSRNPTSVDVRL